MTLLRKEALGVQRKTKLPLGHRTVFLTGLALLLILAPSAVASQIAPGFTLTDINGAGFSLSDFKGKVVLLDFFAIFCDPCVEEMQHLSAIQHEFGEGIAIISIDITPDVDTVENLQQFSQDHNMSWIIARDTEGVMDQYGVQVVPTLILVDKEGFIQYRHIGLTDESVLQQEISQIIPEYATWIQMAFAFSVSGIALIIYRRRFRSSQTCSGK
jgi:peroxiredoxin